MRVMIKTKPKHFFDKLKIHDIKVLRGKDCFMYQKVQKNYRLVRSFFLNEKEI
ncbi:MAG: hypothetical protein CM15mP102_13450 [Flavobacteriales bacterium]|nr:MAG: hypothetical protein CM15mP102_13450 [Flavobacteriales bacterium]